MIEAIFKVIGWAVCLLWVLSHLLPKWKFFIFFGHESKWEQTVEEELNKFRERENKKGNKEQP